MPIFSSSFCLSRSWDLNKICYKSGVPIIENGMIERVSAGHGWPSRAPPGAAVDHQRMTVDRLWWGQGLSAPGAVRALLTGCGKVQVWEAQQGRGVVQGALIHPC